MMEWNVKTVAIIAGGAIAFLIVLMIILSLISALGSLGGGTTDKGESKSPSKTSGLNNDVSTDNTSDTTTRSLAKKGSIIGNLTEEGQSDSAVNNNTKKNAKDPLAFLESGSISSHNTKNNNESGNTTTNHDIVSCRIRVLNSSDEETEVSLTSDSSEANVVQMQIWTPNIKATKWINYKSLYTAEIDENDDKVYARFKDSEGNISSTCSDDL